MIHVLYEVNCRTIRGRAIRAQALEVDSPRGRMYAGGFRAESIEKESTL